MSESKNDPCLSTAAQIWQLRREIRWLRRMFLLFIVAIALAFSWFGSTVTANIKAMRQQAHAQEINATMQAMRDELRPAISRLYETLQDHPAARDLDVLTYSMRVMENRR